MPIRHGGMWQAVLPPAHGTISAAALWHPAYRDPRRGTSFCCRYRCRLPRSQSEFLRPMPAPCLWCPLPAYLLTGKEHGRTIPLPDRSAQRTGRGDVPDGDMRDQTDGIATLIRCNGYLVHDRMGWSQRRRRFGSFHRPRSPFGHLGSRPVTVDTDSKGCRSRSARIAGHPGNIGLFL
jgi:hypothetical protein